MVRVTLTLTLTLTLNPNSSPNSHIKGERLRLLKEALAAGKAKDAPDAEDGKTDKARTNERTIE